MKFRVINVILKITGGRGVEGTKEKFLKLKVQGLEDLDWKVASSIT